MLFSDEQLISFLLGDAPIELVERIRAELLCDVRLLERMSELRILLGHVDSTAAAHEPPIDLVESTLARIDAEMVARSQVNLGRMLHHSADTHLRANTRLRPRRNIWDSTVLTLSLSAICCLALPAMIHMRFEARKEQCAYNLRDLGQGLSEYTFRSHDGRFPQIPVTGRGAFAGLFAVRLNDAGLLKAVEQLRCPSLPAPEIPFSIHADQPGTARMMMPNCLPSFAELCELSQRELTVYRFNCAGDYAYGLGVTEDSRPVPPRNAGRSHFAILADAPVFDGDREMFQAHDGAGINILYEDGRVQFLTALIEEPAQHLHHDVARGLSTGFSFQASAASLPYSLDHPFRNFEGQHRIGLHPQDASLAPSYFTPLGR